MKLPELLSPAGGMPALHAAVDFGADAVYLGYSSFGARASAANFNAEELSEAVRYAHLYHTRVYVTVNTLIKPQEMDGVREALQVISSCGADAVLVQDLGVAKIVLSEFPQLALHASTQMAICNAEGTALAKQAGFRRVVLARECSIEEIRKAVATGVEIEVFVHGALCSAVSGRCLMSSMSGGRSGNRGRCAQPCRQEYRLGEQEGALLSLRDLCLIDHIPELIRANVSSLKIEGRLKSPEYVAVVTREYRKALDAYQSGAAFDAAQSKEELLQIFNRGGFTLGHAFGSEDAQMVTGSHVSHEGVSLGTVKKVRGSIAEVLLERSLSDGDSLQIQAAGSQEYRIDLRYSGKNVPEGGLASVYLRDAKGVREGCRVFRLASADQLEAVRSAKAPKIPIAGKASFKTGEPSMFELTDGNVTVVAEGSLPQKAQKRSATAEEVQKQLCKFGDTPFELKQGMPLIELEDGLFLPVGELNALRRQAAELLTQKCISDFESRISLPYAPLCKRHRLTGDAGLTVLSPDLSLQKQIEEAGARRFVYTPRIWNAAFLEEALSAVTDPIWLRLPPQLTASTYESLLAVIRNHEDRLAGLWLESFSQLGIQTDLPVIAGEGIPVTNKEAVSFLQNAGLSGFCLWPEWTRQEQFDHAGQTAYWKVYGRQNVMLLNHCMKRCTSKLHQGRSNCNLCTRQDAACALPSPVLYDRKGYGFPLLSTHYPEGCEISVLGALPTELSAYIGDAQSRHLTPFLHFTIEDPDEQLAITRHFAALLRGEHPEPLAQKGTTGHWLHGVE